MSSKIVPPLFASAYHDDLETEELDLDFGLLSEYLFDSDFGHPNQNFQRETNESKIKSEGTVKKTASSASKSKNNPVISEDEGCNNSHLSTCF